MSWYIEAWCIGRLSVPPLSLCPLAIWDSTLVCKSKRVKTILNPVLGTGEIYYDPSTGQNIWQLLKIMFMKLMESKVKGGLIRQQNFVFSWWCLLKTILVGLWAYEQLNSLLLWYSKYLKWTFYFNGKSKLLEKCLLLCNTTLGHYN